MIRCSLTGEEEAEELYGDLFAQDGAGEGLLPIQTAEVRHGFAALSRVLQFFVVLWIIHAASLSPPRNLFQDFRSSCNCWNCSSGAGQRNRKLSLKS